MRIYVMTDMEGVCGVMNFEDWCEAQSRYYEKGRELLTREINAAIEGFLDAGAVEVVVADGHGAGAIDGSSLHPAASLMRGWPKPYPFGLDDGKFDAIAWVGQHPKAGTAYGHLCHTGTFLWRDASVNGVSVGEFGKIALCASELGIRSIFCSGDEALAKEATVLVPGIESVAVKRGVNPNPGHHLPHKAYAALNTAAIHLSPEEARRRIRASAKRSVERSRRENFGLISLTPPFEQVDLLRGDETEPPRVGRNRHASSVIALFNMPLRWEPIEAADPLKLL